MTDLSDMTAIDLAAAIDTYGVTLGAAYADVEAIPCKPEQRKAIEALGLQVKQLYNLARETAARAVKVQEVTEAMADRAKNAIRILMLNYSEDFLDAVARAALTAALNGEEG